jgi:hypothetical protein
MGRSNPKADTWVRPYGRDQPREIWRIATGRLKGNTVHLRKFENRY